MGYFKHRFRRRSRVLIGVDISDAYVRVLELDRIDDSYRVLAYASHAMPAGAINDFVIVDATAVAEATRKALERSGSRSRDAAIAVSGPAVFSKTILLPTGLDEAELEQQIYMDAEHHIPHPLDEVNLDFQVLGQAADNPDFDRILLVACRRDDIEVRIAALEMAGLRVGIVDVEEYALQNASKLLSDRLIQIGAAESLAVFDIGNDNTRLTIERDGQSLYTRQFGFGGNQLIGGLVEQYELADAHGLRVKLYAGDIKAEDIASQIHRFAERLAAQIDRVLSFYQSAADGGDEAIAHVVLVGTPIAFPGLSQALADYLPWPFTLGNPLDGMLASTTARRNHIDIDAPSLMVATGLALRGVA